MEKKKLVMRNTGFTTTVSNPVPLNILKRYLPKGMF